MHYVAIRGNVETRLRKINEPDASYDAVVLAQAGLNRLELDAAYVVLEPELLPPAPGQAALALQMPGGRPRACGASRAAARSGNGGGRAR